MPNSLWRWVVMLGIVVLVGSRTEAPAGVHCDGVDDFLDSNTVLSNLITAGASTIMVWYTPTTPNPSGASNCLDNEVQAIAGAGNHSQVLTRRSTTQLCALNSDPGTDGVIATYTNDGVTPLHLTLRHTGGTLYIYKDGVEAATTASGNTTPLTDEFMVCGNLPLYTALGGRVHEVLVFNTGLAVDEIEVRAKSRVLGLGRTQPTAHWRLETVGDGSAAHGTVFPDRSGNARTLTADDGANNTGMTGHASVLLRYQGGFR